MQINIKLFSEKTLGHLLEWRHLLGLILYVCLQFLGHMIQLNHNRAGIVC